MQFFGGPPGGFAPPSAFGAPDTRMHTDCTYYLRGLCRNGDACPFRHDPVRRRARTCLAHAHALSPGVPSHSISHDALLQTKIGAYKVVQAQQDCVFFLQGMCKKGSLCPYRHDPVRCGICSAWSALAGMLAGSQLTRHRCPPAVQSKLNPTKAAAAAGPGQPAAAAPAGAAAPAAAPASHQPPVTVDFSDSAADVRGGGTAWTGQPLDLTRALACKPAAAPSSLPGRSGPAGRKPAEEAGGPGPRPRSQQRLQQQPQEQQQQQPVRERRAEGEGLPAGIPARLAGRLGLPGTRRPVGALGLAAAALQGALGPAPEQQQAAAQQQQQQQRKRRPSQEQADGAPPVRVVEVVAGEPPQPAKRQARQRPGGSAAASPKEADKPAPPASRPAPAASDGKHAALPARAALRAAGAPAAEPPARREPIEFRPPKSIEEIRRVRAAECNAACSATAFSG